MGWELAAGLNGVIALAYVAISSLVLLGLLRTRQVTSNPLAIATAAIFMTCAVHHGHHAAHLVSSFGSTSGELLAVRAAFGSWHTLAVDGLGALVALTYLGLRRSYKALLNTPAMFDDAVRVAAEARLREIAYTDQLTGIPNRAAYQQRADALGSDEGPATVLFVDLDGFKAVNDELGHDVGDRLLTALAQALVEGLPAGADAYRLGGDEFVVVAAGADQPRTAELVALVRGIVATPLPVRSGTIAVSASIGTAHGPASTVDALVRDADASMYARKRERAGLPHSRSEAVLRFAQAHPA